MSVFPTSQSASCLLSPTVGGRNGDRAAKPYLPLVVEVSIHIKRDPGAGKACEMYVTTADVFVKIQAGVTLASEAGHRANVCRGGCLGHCLTDMKLSRQSSVHSEQNPV